MDSGRLYPIVFVSAICAAIALIVYGVAFRSITPAFGAYLVVLCVSLASSVALFLTRIRREGRLGIESNWGGLGGGLSGWRVSASVIFLLISIGLFALLASAIGGETPGPDLFERYRAALNLAQQTGIAFQKREIVGHKLVLKGSAPTQTAVDGFWNQVKLANPAYDDVAADFCITTSNSPCAPAAGGAK